MDTARKERVCATGSGGFIASWVVKLLLSKGYIVHGTARDPDDQKYDYLKKLDGASDNLKLFKADLLDTESMRLAIEGCTGVLHIACPIIINPTDPAAVLQPCINGTLNVLKACSEANVKRFVYVSSEFAVIVTRSWPDDKVMDESCWSDMELCKKVGLWYGAAKTEAESMALDYGKRNGLDVVSICPGFTFGPVLIPTPGGSPGLLIDLVQGKEMYQGQIWMGLSIVDVRDVAAAILLSYEKPEAEGRYICTAHNVKVQEVIEMLRIRYPEFSYYDNYDPDRKDSTLSPAKLQKLGWTYRPLEETLVDSIENYRATGLLKL